MIVQLRGTSGSGKSTVARAVMEKCGVEWAVTVAGRKRPLYYVLKNGARVLGHYETPCGGCDTIKTLDEMFELALGADNGVLMEGLLLTGETKRTLKAAAAGVPLCVVLLSTPVEICLDRIRGRRLRRSEFRPLNPKNTLARAKVAEVAARRLEADGVPVHRLSGEAALEKVLGALGYSEHSSE